ncbi:MAG: adenosine kinase [Bdellovibrionales bacterium]|nr:adenosine kinase [Bdellovibrionales bacterium]
MSQSKDLHIYGIGNAIMDIQLQALDTDIEHLKLTKGGMALVDAEVQRDLLEFFRGKPLFQASGGSAANTMIAACQLGARTGYGCVVGDDPFGSYYWKEMAELGVELHNAPRPGGPTGTCVILITPDSERTMNTHLGISAAFSESDLSEEAIARAEWLYIEGYLLTSPSGSAAAARACEIARETGTKIAVSFADAFVVAQFREALDSVVRYADLVFANKTEAETFAGSDDEERAFDVLKNQLPNAVMTLHERGARVWYDGEVLSVPSFPVVAVDSTGAGDMFAGAMLQGLVAGRSAGHAAKVACFYASRVVSQIGARLQGDLSGLASEAGIQLSAE